MAKLRQSNEHRAAIDALLPSVEAAFAGPSFWRPFLRDAHAAGIPRLSSWLEGAGRVVEDQVRRRGLRHLRSADMPLSTSPMGGLIEPIRAALHPRRHGLKNRERTNRLLLLISCTPTARTTCSPTPRTSERGWRPITAAHACPAALSPTDAAVPSLR